jgi:hypothetical protein
MAGNNGSGSVLWIKIDGRFLLRKKLQAVTLPPGYESTRSPHSVSVTVTPRNQAPGEEFG